VLQLQGSHFYAPTGRATYVAFLCMLLQGPVVYVPKVGPLLKLLNAYAFIRLLSPTYVSKGRATYEAF
jgi:hypothetical protein